MCNVYSSSCSQTYNALIETVCAVVNHMTDGAVSGFINLSLPGLSAGMEILFW